MSTLPVESKRPKFGLNSFQPITDASRVIDYKQFTSNTTHMLHFIHEHSFGTALGKCLSMQCYVCEQNVSEFFMFLNKRLMVWTVNDAKVPFHVLTNLDDDSSSYPIWVIHYQWSQNLLEYSCHGFHFEQTLIMTVKRQLHTTRYLSNCVWEISLLCVCTFLEGGGGRQGGSLTKGEWGQEESLYSVV